MRRHRLLRLYAWALRLCPASFRERYGAELLHTQQRLLREARGVGGSGYVMRFVGELLDVLKTALRLRLRRVAPEAHRKRGEAMAGFGAELRASWRSVTRTPSFTLSAVIALGAGLGCAGAAFAVLHGMILQPLAHPRSDELVMVWQQLAEPPILRGPMSYPTLADLRTQSAPVGSIEAYAGGASAVLRGDERVELVNGARVSGGLMPMLGNAPALGRVLQEADDDPAAEPVVVISHGLWDRHFRGDAALGRTLMVNDIAHRIVGVMYPEFGFPSTRAEFWIPLRLVAAQQPRDRNFLVAVARLRPGVRTDNAQRTLTNAYERLRSLYPQDLEGRRLQVESRRD